MEDLREQQMEEHITCSIGFLEQKKGIICTLTEPGKTK